VITVTKQQIVDFINVQPASRPVNMRQNYSRDLCGCIMVHYGKEVLKIDDFGCGYNDWSDAIGNEHYAKIVDEENDITIVDIVGDWRRSGIPMRNYGDLQKIVGGQM
jgi:hypothetical protein